MVEMYLLPFPEDYVKLLAEFLALILMAGVLWAAPPPTQPAHPTASSSPSDACAQEWQAMARRHREQADAMLKQISGMRSLLTMLRSDAGIVHDSTVRDALQVNADMWESLLGTWQKEAASLHDLAQQEESRRQTLCRFSGK